EQSNQTIKISTIAGEVKIPDINSSVQFSQLTVAALDSSIKLNGAIDDPMKARRFNQLAIELNYNAAKIWSVVVPMLSDSTRESLKDMKLDATFSKTIHVGGSYPADKGSKAIGDVIVDGELAIKSLEASGATLKDFILPFTLRDGIARVAYPKGSAKE